MVDGREFSRELEIARIPVEGRSFAIEADREERAALARRFGLEALDRLRAEGRVRRIAGGEVTVVEGRLEASVTQLCVVTLEPVSAQPVVTFSRSFVATREVAPGPIVIDPLADEPEPLAGSTLDLGEIVAEELALALDPYPRRSGVEAVGHAPLAAPASARAAGRGRRDGERR